jgi:hypothetical protein
MCLDTPRMWTWDQGRGTCVVKFNQIVVTAFPAMAYYCREQPDASVYLFIIDRL